MSINSIDTPYKVFSDVDGSPLEDGYIYVGEPSQNPEVVPANAFWDSSLTTPAAQPLRTLGGHVSRSGTPSVVYIDGDYSITVRDKNGSLVYTSPVATGILSSINSYDEISELIGYESAPDGTSVNVIGYHVANDGGGGIFNWDESVDKATANIGTIIDPSVSLANQGTGIGNGCWIRQYSGVVNVKWFGAVGDGVADDTISIQAAITEAKTADGNTVLIPSGIYTVSQISLPTLVNITGEGVTNTIISGEGNSDTIITSEPLFEQKFKNFMVTHTNNTNAGTHVLVHLLHGANGCFFDMMIEGKEGISGGGFWLRGKNPVDLTANNNQYNNQIRIRARKVLAGAEVIGTAIWLYGEDLSQARANANKILSGSVISGWSEGLIVRGALNDFFGLQINPCSSFGVKILQDTGGESTENTFIGTGFDGVWTGDKIQIVNEADAYTFHASFQQSGIDINDVVFSGTFANKSSVSLLGRHNVLGSHGANNSFDSTVSGGVSRSNDEGVVVFQGSKSVDESKIIIGGTGVGETQGCSVGGVSIMLIDTVDSEFRIVSSSNGTGATQQFIFTNDGVLRWGPAGVGEFTIRKGTGSPEGIVTARVGAIYSRTDGGANATLYIKESGTSSTGWIAK